MRWYMVSIEYSMYSFINYPNSAAIITFFLVLYLEKQLSFRLINLQYLLPESYDAWGSVELIIV